MEREIEIFATSLMKNEKPSEQILSLTQRLDQHKYFADKIAEYLKDLLEAHISFGKGLNRVINKYAFLCNDDWNSPLSEFFSHLHLYFTNVAVNSNNLGSILNNASIKLKTSSRSEFWNEMKSCQKQAVKSAETHLKIQKKLKPASPSKKPPSTKVLERAQAIKLKWENDCTSLCKVIATLETTPFTILSEFISSFIQKNESTLTAFSSSLSTLKQALEASSDIHVVHTLTKTLEQEPMKKPNSSFIRRLSFEKQPSSTTFPLSNTLPISPSSPSNDHEANGASKEIKNIETNQPSNALPLNEQMTQVNSPQINSINDFSSSPSKKDDTDSNQGGKFRIALKQTPLSPVLSLTQQVTPSTFSQDPTISPPPLSPKMMNVFDPFSESPALAPSPSISPPPPPFFESSSASASPPLAPSSSSSPPPPSPLLTTGSNPIQPSSPNDVFDPFVTYPTLIHSPPLNDPSSSSSLNSNHPTFSTPSSSPALLPLPVSPHPRVSDSSFTTNGSPVFSPSPSASPFLINDASPSSPQNHSMIASSSFNVPHSSPTFSSLELTGQELVSAIVIHDQLVKYMVKGQICTLENDPWKTSSSFPYVIENPRQWTLLTTPTSSSPSSTVTSSSSSPSSSSILLRYQYTMEHVEIPSLDVFPCHLHIQCSPLTSVSSPTIQATFQLRMLPDTHLEKMVVTCGPQVRLNYQGYSATEHTLKNLPSHTSNSFHTMNTMMIQEFQADILQGQPTYLEVQVTFELPRLLSNIQLVHPTEPWKYPIVKAKCRSSLVVFRYPFSGN